MDGLIVKQPYAQQLVTRKKRKEYRSTQLPKNKFSEPVLILTPQKDGGLVLGEVTFIGQLANDDGFEWIAIDGVEYNRKWKYKIKSGCVIWMKDVEFESKQQIIPTVNHK